MARQPRLSLAGFPHHVIQRGNNRQAIFYSDDDRKAYLAWLSEYAFVLMDNHTHLLLTPQDDSGVPNLMQALGKRYAQSFNHFHKRTGTLWEGRYKSTLIQDDKYLLTCMTYIDLNPVRAGIAALPSDFQWSSHKAYIGQQAISFITPHPLLWTLGNTPFARETAYSKLVAGGLAAQDQTELTESAFKGWALGDEPFMTKLQALTPRRTSKMKVGRGTNKPVPN
jgi:putative transposase